MTPNKGRQDTVKGQERPTERAKQPAVNGFLNGFTLFGISQMLILESKSCLVEVTNGGLRGTVIFSHGELVDADLNGTRGDRAAEMMLGWDRPTIWIHENTAPVRITVTRPVTQLLLESLRKLDEMAYQQANPEATLESLEPSFVLTADAEKRLGDMAQSKGVLALGIVDVERQTILAKATSDSGFDVEQAMAEVKGAAAVKSLATEEIDEIRVSGRDALYVLRPFSHTTGACLIVAFEREFSGASRTIRRLTRLGPTLIASA